jgi:hypothetical protein
MRAVKLREIADIIDFDHGIIFRKNYHFHFHKRQTTCPAGDSLTHSHYEKKFRFLMTF